MTATRHPRSPLPEPAAGAGAGRGAGLGEPILLAADQPVAAHAALLCLAVGTARQAGRRPLCPRQSASAVAKSAGGICGLALCVRVRVNLRHLCQNLLASAVHLRPCQSAPSVPESARRPLCICVRVNLRHLCQNLLVASVYLRPCQSAPSVPESAGGLCASGLVALMRCWLGFSQNHACRQGCRRSRGFGCAATFLTLSQQGWK